MLRYCSFTSNSTRVPVSAATSLRERLDERLLLAQRRA